MSNTKSIYLFRHPETQAPKGTCYGNSDVRPNAQQLDNALVKIRKAIPELVPDVVYSSPLTRCTMLAEKLTEGGGVITDELLREIDFGRWEMIPWDKIPGKEREIWGNDFINNKIHGGENFFDVQDRVIRFWDKITASQETSIFVVAHAGLFRALLAFLLEASPRKIFAIDMDYGDAVRVRWDNENYYKIKFL